jgi:triacylglycerol lipase
MDNTALAYFLGGSRREKPEVYVAASPAAHVSAGDPVTQIIHGESDLLVSMQESRQFHQLQRAAGIDSRLEIMPKQGHMITFLNPKTNQKMLEFFQEVLLAGSSSPAARP